MAEANMSIAAFLVVRGPYSYVTAPMQVVSRGDWSDPFFQLYRLDTGKPTGPCTESTDGVFSRKWSGGSASVDCAAAKGVLNFGLLPEQ
jgi:hypothetical protein